MARRTYTTESKEELFDSEAAEKLQFRSTLQSASSENYANDGTGNTEENITDRNEKYERTFESFKKERRRRKNGKTSKRKVTFADSKM